MTEKNGKTKLIWWLVGIVFAVTTWVFSFVISTQAKTDMRQDNQLQKIQDLVDQNTQQLSKILGIMNSVNIIQMNAALQAVDGRTERLERKLGL